MSDILADARTALNLIATGTTAQARYDGARWLEVIAEKLVVATQDALYAAKAAAPAASPGQYDPAASEEVAS